MSITAQPILQFFARLHPLVVHLPVGILLVGVGMVFLSRFKRWAPLQAALPIVWGLGAIAAAVACASGWLLAKNEGGDPETLQVHQWLGICILVMSAAMAFLQEKFTRSANLSLIYAAVMGFFIAGTTHLGATLTYGEGYLWKKPPTQEGAAERMAESGVTPADDVPTQPIAAANPADLAALTQAGLHFVPISNGSNYLSINAFNAPAFSDRDAKALAKVAPQIVWLKLGGTAITDSTLAIIGQCTNLTRLFLDHTKITDGGLALLKNNLKLQRLNLSGTAVTAQGLAHLREMPALQQLFLFQAQVKSSDWVTLKTYFPKTQIDTGGYAVPTLATDTTVLKKKP